MHELGVVEDRMLPRSVAGKEMCRCRFMLRFQEGRDVVQP
jgi:hypothetical protein